MDSARALIRDADTITVFTGAGMSADSGLDTYRDAVTGVWENVDPTAMASIDAWAVRPEEMWAWYQWRAELARRATPNAGHQAIASDPRTEVITQNIDNLHERAGSTRVTHLHGSLFDYRCCMCGRPWRGQLERMEVAVEKRDPPTCPLCGNLVRPSVVWFGEGLPQREWEHAEQCLAECDVLLIVGTSGVVQPAASLPLIAVQMGTPIIEVTLAETDLSRIADEVLLGRAAEVVPQLFTD